jgi:hypothetical protein
MTLTLIALVVPLLILSGSSARQGRRSTKKRPSTGAVKA